MVPRSHVIFYSFWHSIIIENTERKLKDSLGKSVDLEDKLYDSREKSSNMDSGMFPLTNLLILDDLTWMFLTFG